MPIIVHRSSSFESHLQRTDVASLIETLTPHLERRLEIIATYALTCALWGVVIWAALTFALQ